MWTMLAFVKSLGTKPGDLAGHWFIRAENLVQCQSMLVIVYSPSTNARWTGTWLEQQTNAVLIN